MKSIRLLLCLLTASSAPAVINAQQVLELENKLSAMRGSAVPALNQEASDLNSLVYDQQPTLYYINGLLTQTENKAPVRVVSDIASLGLLGSRNPLFNTIQVLCIKIEDPDDLNGIVDMEALPDFSGLKYIFFMCSFQLCSGQADNSACETEKIASMVRGPQHPSLQIIYTSTISE